MIEIKNKEEMLNTIRHNKYYEAQIRVYNNDKEKTDFEIIGNSNIEDDHSPLTALQDATLAFTKSDDEETHFNYVRMPKMIFEQEWWKNRHKTADDIRKLAIDA